MPAECCVAMILWLPMCSSSDSVLIMRAWRAGSATTRSSSAPVRATSASLSAAKRASAPSSHGGAAAGAGSAFGSMISNILQSGPGGNGAPRLLVYTPSLGGSIVRKTCWFVVCVVAAPLYAQSARPGETWESIAKLPDFVGLWEVTFGGGPRGGGEPPSLTPDYAAKQREYQAAQQRGEIEDTQAANCVPNGMP